MKDHKFKSIDGIIANVRLMLNSFDDSGLINEGDLLRWSRWVVEKIGLSLYKEKELILDVEESSVEIPSDFSMLWSLQRCFTCNSTPENAPSTRYYFGLPKEYIVEDHTKKICYNKCDISYSEKEVVRRSIYIEQKEYVSTYCRRQLLSLNKHVPKTKLATSCLNLQCNSPDSFNMDEKKFYFNFEKGAVHLQYYAFPMDSSGYPEILDDAIMEKAVEDYLIYQSFLQIYYNSNADVLQRMQKAEQEHIYSIKEAIRLGNLPELSSLINLGKQRASSLGIFNLSSRADGIRKHH